MIPPTTPQSIPITGTIPRTSIILFLGVIAVSIAFRIAHAVSRQYQSGLLARLSITTGSDISALSDDSSSSAFSTPPARSSPPQNRSHQVNVYLPVRSTSSTYEWAAVASDLSRIDAEELKHNIDTAFLSCYPEEFAVEVTTQDGSASPTTMATPAQLSIPRAWETKLSVAVEQAGFDQSTGWSQSSPQI